MSEIDLSGLDDEQLVTLVRAVSAEVAARHPAVRMAAEDAVLDEGEKAKIIREAADREVGKLRAIAREKLAQETAAKIRREAAEKQAEIDKIRGVDADQKNAEEGRRLAAEIKKKEDELSKWVDRWRKVLEIDGDFCIIRYDGRLLINKGHDRYAKTHLVDWEIGTATISTVRKLMQKKPEIVALAHNYLTATLYKQLNIYDKKTTV